MDHRRAPPLDHDEEVSTKEIKNNLYNSLWWKQTFRDLRDDCDLPRRHRHQQEDPQREWEQVASELARRSGWTSPSTARPPEKQPDTQPPGKFPLVGSVSGGRGEGMWDELDRQENRSTAEDNLTAEPTTTPTTSTRERAQQMPQDKHEGQEESPPRPPQFPPVGSGGGQRESLPGEKVWARKVLISIFLTMSLRAMQ